MSQTDLTYSTGPTDSCTPQVRVRCAALPSCSFLLSMEALEPAGRNNDSCNGRNVDDAARWRVPGGGSEESEAVRMLVAVCSGKLLGRFKGMSRAVKVLYGVCVCVCVCVCS